MNIGNNETKPLKPIDIYCCVWSPCSFGLVLHTRTTKCGFQCTHFLQRSDYQWEGAWQGLWIAPFRLVFLRTMYVGACTNPGFIGCSIDDRSESAPQIFANEYAGSKRNSRVIVACDNSQKDQNSWHFFVSDIYLTKFLSNERHCDRNFFLLIWPSMFFSLLPCDRYTRLAYMHVVVVRYWHICPLFWPGFKNVNAWCRIIQTWWGFVSLADFRWKLKFPMFDLVSSLVLFKTCHLRSWQTKLPMVN